MQGENVLFPGHGAVIPKGNDTFRRYMRNRVEREEQLLALLMCRPNDKASVTKATAYPVEFLHEVRGRVRAGQYKWTLRQFIQALYENYSLTAYPAIARGLLLHLQKLSMLETDLVKPPFPVSGPFVLSPLARHAPLVKCSGIPSYQYSGTRTCPDLPRNEKEWGETLDLAWHLVAII